MFHFCEVNIVVGFNSDVFHIKVFHFVRLLQKRLSQTISSSKWLSYVVRYDFLRVVYDSNVDDLEALMFKYTNEVENAKQTYRTYLFKWT